jgi:hypothetical protein
MLIRGLPMIALEPEPGTIVGIAVVGGGMAALKGRQKCRAAKA